MTAAIIALIISLGIITSPADLDNLTQDQQEQIDTILNTDINDM
jgi:hypothetical protein